MYKTYFFLSFLQKARWLYYIIFRRGVEVGMGVGAGAFLLFISKLFLIHYVLRTGVY